jgi:uncharacterized membrane protein YhhN
MNYFFIWAAVVIAVVDWIAVARQWKRLEYIAKPGVMLALLAWLVQVGGFQGHMLWFAIGVVFSLAGDVFLMLPRERFIAGLVAFLLAHVAYIGGLNTALPPVSALSLGLPVAAVALFGLVTGAIVSGMKASGNSKLQAPVIIYAGVITLMLLSALLNLARTEAGLGGTGGSWSLEAALLVSAGAALFFYSDANLAWNKFVRPLKWGRLRTMITYHLGQSLIVVGAGINFLQGG